MTTIATRAQYMGREIDHKSYYRQFVTETTIADVVRVFGIEELDRAFAKDEHLNSIPLARWDSFSWYPVTSAGVYRQPSSGSDSGPFRSILAVDREALTAAGETLTRAVLVCIAKQAAEVAIERHRAGA